MEELGSNIEMIDSLVQHGAPTIFWTGGPISQRSGDTVSSRLKLFNTAGSTEQGAWPVLRKMGEWDPSAWRYMTLDPGSNIQLRRVTGALHTAVVVKNSKSRSGGRAGDEVQPVFRLFPELTEYDTHDLLQQCSEPGKGHLWLHCGRSDDLQVFLTGEKLHPVAIEQMILDNGSMLREALLVATGLPKVVLLLEPKANGDDEAQHSNETSEEGIADALLDEVWPKIEAANAMLPQNAKIAKDRVVFTKPYKPLPRNGKGTVQRKQAVIEYEEEIQAILKGAESMGW